MAKAIKKQALGRGLSALLNDDGSSHSHASKSAAQFVALSLDQIKVNPYQPRTRFSESALKELESSIKALGLIQPITVRETKDGYYELVSGERRYRASKNIGLKEIPAYIRSANDQELLEMALVENIQRQDLDPIEIALTYQRLLEDVSLSITELGDRLGKDRTTITNYLRLLKLDPLIQSGMRDGFISMGHGRSLINIEHTEDQLALYEEILDKKLFPMTLGGEHSITPGCIVPFTKKYKNICLLHFDAHADLRQSYNGEKFSHASAIRRCLDYKNVSLISFGIRNISESEIPFLKTNSSRINIFWAKDKKKWNLSKFKKLIKNKTVYLTFDVDGLDSSIMPATGTPEPGGLLWDETLDIIRIAAKNSKIVGADINELSPIKGFNSYNFLVAKLAYKILSYKFLY